ncbi:chloroplast envelope quinone oxidoreductase homolog [Nicotiana tabacum]|uniref:Chloroplast envelope quinone oxidoreductase homolog n=2 Tax=Nicotiana TaxID=4085 RepID=A0A1S4A602_TOBAC|nr:PREDICTED: putative quinone-oxidoreductase homolog, chloroplastic [Nicotiana sylvestris]XP_016471996.1 PREDICTED: putative quinone-oxidoreductase homolog, chloroplastic [Nicotiana tabacum]
MAVKLMRTVQYDSYGGGAVGLKHVEVPVPTPDKDEVLLKLEATSLNPLDLRFQNGVNRPFVTRKFPVIPGTDVAGEVVEVGSSVVKFKAGDKVVAILNLLIGGGLAEYAVAKESFAVPRPENVSAAEGACLPIAALTAHKALVDVAGIKLDGSGPRMNILVTAASGGVGHYAVQLAKLGNTHVTGTCGARNIDFVKSLGADEVLDYKTPEGAALKSPSGQKYDAVVHCAKYIPWSTFEPNLSESGKVIDLTPGPSAICTYVFQKLTLSKKQLLPFILIPKGDKELNLLVRLVKEGKFKTVVDSKHPLSKAQDAWAKMIDGHATGKIIVEQ